jgi:hypothetical protein
MNFEEAKKLKFGQVLYHRAFRNADGSPQRWKVNGKIKLWKTRPDEIKIPVKNGLKNFGYVTELTLDLFETSEEKALL